MFIAYFVKNPGHSRRRGLARDTTVAVAGKLPAAQPTAEYRMKAVLPTRLRTIEGVQHEQETTAPFAAAVAGTSQRRPHRKALFNIFDNHSRL